jgi:hypothetical protein
VTNMVWNYVWSQPIIHGQSPPPLRPGEAVSACSSSFIPEDGYLSVLKSQERNTFPRSIKTFFSKRDDHGTFVAGLVASTNNRALGIIPGTHLYLYDLENLFSCSFDKYMRMAMSSGVFVFSISQKLPCDTENEPPAYCALKDLVRSATNNPAGNLPYHSLLFVVAAGNDGINLNVDGPNIPSPVSWAKDLPNNVLVVGAIKLDTSVPMVDGSSNPRFNSGMLYVDLLAPGVDIYSSASSNSYAMTSGTSAATPLVSAVAAKLFVTLKDPRNVKARLIYTADWSDDYLQWSLGGRLNADRALNRPTENVFVIDGYPGAQVVDYNPNDKVEIKNTHEAFIVDRKLVENGNPPNNNADVPSNIALNKILRMFRMPNGLYRIIYLDKEKQTLRILMNAKIGGTIDLTLHGTPKNKILKKTSYNQLADFVSSGQLIPERPITFLR